MSVEIAIAPPFSHWEKGWGRGVSGAMDATLKPSPRPSPEGRGSSTIIANCFDRASSQCLFTCRALFFVFGLLGNVGVSVLERAREIIRSSIAADIAVDAGAINVKRTGSVLFDAVVSVRHMQTAFRVLSSRTVQNQPCGSRSLFLVRTPWRGDRVSDVTQLSLYRSASMPKLCRRNPLEFSIREGSSS